MKHEFARSAAWTAAANWLEQAASLVIFIVVARLIGAEAFGVAALAFAFLFLGEVLVRDTLTEGIIARSDPTERQLSAVFFGLVAFAGLIVIALLLTSRFAGHLFGAPEVGPLLAASSPCVLMIGAAGVSTALLRRRLAFRALAIRSIAGVVAGGVVGILMAVNDFGAWSLVGQRLALTSVNAAFAIAAARWLPRHAPRRADLHLLTDIGPRVLLLRAISIVIAQTPTIALGIAADPRSVGLFAFAARLAEIVIFVVVNPFKAVSQSAFAAIRHQGGKAGALFLDVMEVTAFGSFAALVGLAMIAGPLTTLLASGDWSDAGALMPFLCIAGAVVALTSIQESYVLAHGSPDRFARASGFEALIGVPLAAAGSVFGAPGVACAVALRALVILPMRTRAALDIEGLAARDFARALAGPLLAAGGMALAVGAWRYLMGGVLSAPLFVASAVMIGIAVFGAILFGAMPKSVARLRSFVVARP